MENTKLNVDKQDYVKPKGTATNIKRLPIKLGAMFANCASDNVKTAILKNIKDTTANDRSSNLGMY